MDERHKQMWIDLVTTFVGEDCIKYIIEHPLEPQMEIQNDDTLLGDTVDEEERFLYSLLPKPENAQKVLASSLPGIGVLWDLWWCLVGVKHRISGAIGIRKGWVLVALKQQNPFSMLEEELKKVVVGKFEFKKNDQDKNFMS